MAARASLRKTMKFWLLDLVERVTHALGDISGICISRICFKAVKVDSVSVSFWPRTKARRKDQDHTFQQWKY